MTLRNERLFAEQQTLFLLPHGEFSFRLLVSKVLKSSVAELEKIVRTQKLPLTIDTASLSHLHQRKLPRFWATDLDFLVTEILMSKLLAKRSF